MENIVITWSDIEADLTPENAKKYASVTDKLCFCADLTCLSVDSRLLMRFEDEMIKLAESLGYLKPQSDRLPADWTI